jgi:hypothetical protein
MCNHQPTITEREVDLRGLVNDTLLVKVVNCYLLHRRKNATLFHFSIYVHDFLLCNRT